MPELINLNYEADSKLSLDSLHPELKKTLYGFQLEGVQFGLEKCGRILLGDEMGVGKTIQAIALSSLYKDDWPVIIVCPTSLKFNWKAEIIKWLSCENIKAESVQVINSNKDQIFKISQFIISNLSFLIIKSFL